jgi:hypothetical protein
MFHRSRSPFIECGVGGLIFFWAPNEIAYRILSIGSKKISLQHSPSRSRGENIVWATKFLLFTFLSKKKVNAIPRHEWGVEIKKFAELLGP